MARKTTYSSPTAVRERTVRSSVWIWILLSAVLLVLVVVIAAVLLRSPASEPETKTAAPEAAMSAEMPSPSAAPEAETVPEPSPLPELTAVPDTAAQLRTRYENRQYGFPVLSLDKSLLKTDETGRMTYGGDRRTLTGIDVSEHQYDVDWDKVAGDSIDFVMIRMGRRGSTAGGLFEDEYFRKNITGALNAGLKVGIYFYSQAINTQEAREEAQYLLDAIGEYDVTMPVVFDWEIVGGSDARTSCVDRRTLCDCARVFCDSVADAGYDPMIYFTRYLGYRKYILRELTDYGFWYAEYEAEPSTVFDFTMWQYSDTSHVAGIDGEVDMNLYFLP